VFEPEHIFKENQL